MWNSPHHRAKPYAVPDAPQNANHQSCGIRKQHRSQLQTFFSIVFKIHHHSSSQLLRAKRKGMENLNRSDILRYLLESYFKGDARRLADATGYTVQQVNNWLEDVHEPRASTIEWIIHCALAPEFNVIVEFAPFEPSNKSASRRQQIDTILASNRDKRGIYALYDSTASLIYIGKTDNNLLDEIDQSLKQPINRNFNVKRWSIVRYIGAYHVGGTLSFDYPKHVESLMLGISRPRLNTNIGNLLPLPRDE